MGSPGAGLTPVRAVYFSAVDTADLAVITSGIVGVTGGVVTPILTAVLAGRRESRSARDARSDELRVVIDDASVALIDGIREIPQTPQWIVELETRGELRLTDDARETFYRQMNDAGDTLQVMRAQRARIAARVGLDDELHMTYQRAERTLSSVLSACRAIYTAYQQPTPLQQLTGSPEFRVYLAARVELDHAPDAFYRATADRIGPDGPRSRPATPAPPSSLSADASAASQANTR